jgi:hypothetical protein
VAAPKKRDSLEEMRGGEPVAKGMWFVSAREQILKEHGGDVLARVARRMGDELGAALLTPTPSAWYAETTLQRAMAAVNEEAFGGDRERFVAFVEACTEHGIRRFVRVMLAFNSPGRLLGKMPLFWARHRQNNGELTVDVGERSARLHYTRFPFFDDRNYWLLIRGVLRKAVEVTSGARPDVTVRDYTHDSLVVDVYFGEERGPAERALNRAEPTRRATPRAR